MNSKLLDSFASIALKGGYIPLNEVSLLHLVGPDVEAYLSSQTTNNVLSLLDNSFQLNSLLDLSGKIISSFFLLKKSKTEFYIIVENSNSKACLERIEKYHISEDFEVLEIASKQINLYLGRLKGSKESLFQGRYIFKEAHIDFSEKVEVEAAGFGEIGFDLFEKMRLFSGTPRLGQEVSVGELINNTYLDELSVDYKKGCFPGQETVAKINSRRGAAQKPVLLECSARREFIGEDLFFEDKKVGRVLNIIDSGHLYVTLSRDLRIDQRNLELTCINEILRSTVNYFPYIEFSSKYFAEYFYDLAVSLFHKENYDQSIENFKNVLSLSPEFEDAYESLGVLYGRLEKYDLAIELMERLKDLNPKCMMAYTNLSLYHMKIGEIEKAEDFKSQATFLNFELLGEEASVKKSIEKKEEAEKVERIRKKKMFLEVLDIDEEDSMANNGLGEIYLKERDYKKSKEHFQKAILGNPKYSVAYLGLAKSLKFLKEKEALFETLKKGISVAGKNGDLMPANEMQRMVLDLDL